MDKRRLKDGLPSPRCRCRRQQQQQQRPEARRRHRVRAGPAAEKPGARPPFCGGSAAPWQREGAGRRRGPRRLTAGTAAPPAGQGRARGPSETSSTEASSLPKTPPLLSHNGIVTSPCGSPLKISDSHSNNCMRKGAGFITNGLYKGNYKYRLQTKWLLVMKQATKSWALITSYADKNLMQALRLHKFLYAP